MTTTQTAARPEPAVTPVGRVVALALMETKLVVRNRTTAITSLVLPVGIGLLYVLTFAPGGDSRLWGVVVALQLAITLGMGVYLTATQTVVARRHSRVLKRMRSSGISDAGLLVAIMMPSVAIGLVQLVIYTVIDAATGAPLPPDLLWIAVAVVGGLALCTTAALATTVVTAAPERAQITTLPLVFVLLGGAVVLSIAPLDGWWQAAVALPGAAIGQLSQLAFTGAAWSSGFAGVPVVLPSVVSLVVWTVVFGWVARRRFRWDPRHRDSGTGTPAQGPRHRDPATGTPAPGLSAGCRPGGS